MRVPPKLDGQQIRRGSREAELDLEQHVATHVLPVCCKLEAPVLHRVREYQGVEVVVDHLQTPACMQGSKTSAANVDYNVPCTHR